jgi:chloramphenicol 3-O phosphotransferase
MIIFLNGPSSSGKTSISKSIQKLSDFPWLRIGIDTLIDMIPQDYFGEGPKAALGFSVCSKIDDDGIPKTTIHMGPYGEQVSHTVPKMVRLLADLGHHIIVDEVLLGENHYQNILEGIPTYYIGITCALDILEKREKERGNRCLGMARTQNDIVHKAIQRYDLMVDTSLASSDDIAKKILTFVKTI